MTAPRNIKRQAGRLSTGQINRRRFVMSALASGVTLPTAMSLASKAEGATPRKGGHIRVATPDPVDFDALLTFAIANTLVEQDGNGHIVGDLARDMQPSAGGRVWVFDLERDAAFSDGVALTASYVVESLRPMIDGSQSGVQSIEAMTAHQVRFTLANPDFTFPETLAAPEFAILRTDSQGRRIGTGAYRVTERSADRIRLSRQPEYRKPGRAHFDTVDLTYQPSHLAIQSDFLSGRIDYAAGIAPETLAFFAHLPDVTQTSFPATRALVVQGTAGSDLAVVKALETLRLGLDRNAFVERALLGHGIAGTDTPRPPSGAVLPMQGETLRSLPPRDIPMVSDVAQPWVPHLTEMAKHLGIAISEFNHIKGHSALKASTLTNSEIAKLWEGHPDCVPRGSCETEAHETVRRAFMQAKAVADAAERASAFEQACQTFANHSGVFVPAWANDIAVHRSNLAHAEALTPHMPHDAYRLIERWWIA